jgi:hypothetical protein
VRAHHHRTTCDEATKDTRSSSRKLGMCEKTNIIICTKREIGNHVIWYLRRTGGGIFLFLKRRRATTGSWFGPTRHGRCFFGGGIGPVLGHECAATGVWARRQA